MIKLKITESKEKLNEFNKIIVSELENIDDSIIDEENSSIEVNSIGVYYNLYSKNNQAYPLQLIVHTGEDENRITFSFGFKDNVISEFYYDKIIHKGFSILVQNFIRKFLRSNIFVRETIINSNISRIDLRADKILNSHNSVKKFTRRNKAVFFWHKPEYRETRYVPWIK